MHPVSFISPAVFTRGEMSDDTAQFLLLGRIFWNCIARSLYAFLLRECHALKQTWPELCT